MRVCDEVKERTPRRGLGQPKGKEPKTQERRERVSFYNPRPTQPQPPRARKEYKRSERTEDKRPLGRNLQN